MKKRIVSILLAGMLLMSGLAGCGGGQEMTPMDIVNSTEPIIAYVSEGFVKDSKPKKVVVFENGTGTVYDPGDYTMGDFAKMTDKEIIENLCGVIEDKNNAELDKYQGYLEEAQANLEEVEARYDAMEVPDYSWAQWLELYYEGWVSTDSESEPVKTENLYLIAEIVQAYLRENLSNFDWGVAEALYVWSANSGDAEFGQAASLAEDWNAYMARHEGEKFSPIFKQYFNTGKYGLEEIGAATVEIDTIIAEATTGANSFIEKLREEEAQLFLTDINNYNQKLEELADVSYEGESYKAVIDLITDATGNAVWLETIVLLSEDDMEYGFGCELAMLEGENRAVIYESSYSGYCLSDNNSRLGYLFFRDNSKNGVSLSLDGLKTKGVYIDVTEIEDFFK